MSECPQVTTTEELPEKAKRETCSSESDENLVVCSSAISADIASASGEGLIDAEGDKKPEGVSQDDEDDKVSDSSEEECYTEEEKQLISQFYTRVRERLTATEQHSVSDSASTNVGGDKNKLTILSWNVCGYAYNALMIRTRVAIDIILREFPDIVFLQVVHPEPFRLFVKGLGKKYWVVAGVECPKFTDSNYHVVTLFKRGRVKYEEHYTINFPDTETEAALLVTKVKVGEIKVALLNGNLECGMGAFEERTEQNKQCFELAQSFSPDWNVIFGGDLNGRNREIRKHQPKNMYDVWEECGGNERLKFTWDMAKNDNIQWYESNTPNPLTPGSNAWAWSEDKNIYKDKQFPKAKQPRTRFDRIFFRQAEAPMPTISPIYFKFKGTERIEKLGLFVSTHWAIFTKFRVVSQRKESFVSEADWTNWRNPSSSSSRSNSGNRYGGGGRDNSGINGNWRQ